MRKYTEAGKIINTHGVVGCVKVESWCDTPKVLAGLKTLYFCPTEKGGEYRPMKVVKASVQGENVLIHFDGVNTVEEAEKLKNTVVYAFRDDIPKNGGFLIDDLKGLKVIDENTKEVYGKLTDVVRYGTRDIYEINCGNKTVLLPAVKEFISRIDVNEGIFVTPIKGFF